MADMFDPDTLASYIETFYGYGDYSAPFWFVGIEEGGDNSVEEIEARIAAWYSAGQPELRDPRGYGPDPDTSTSPWFRLHPKSQSTWRQLIRMALVAQNLPTSLDDIKAYQRDRLGRADSAICLLELLPLPSRSTKEWIYHTSGVVELQSRTAYVLRYTRDRAMHIKQRVQQHAPRAVVFYSTTFWYRIWWELIAGVRLTRDKIAGRIIYHAETPSTTFVVVKHPVSVGVTNDYYDAVGRILAMGTPNREL